MNGSRSNTPGYGSKSSLDQLNRTIEGLEARIQGLVSERKGPPPRAAGINPVDEILERQRALGGARDRVTAAMERSPRHEPEVRYQQQDARRHLEARPQPARIEPERAMAPPQSAALDEIAATLAALRAELKHGLNTDHLAYDIGEIRNDMRSLKSATAGSHGGGDQVRDELARLGDSIDRLGAGSHADGIQDLRADLDDLRNMTAGLAREDSIRHLEGRWDRTDSKLAQMNPDALKEELVQLAWRIDDMKSGLGALSAAPAVRALEDKLIALASSIEGLGRNIEARDDLSHQFSGLDRRLDEISRAIAISANQSAASTDSAAFHRLEDRVAELTAHIDMLQAPARENDVATRIDALTQRIEELANEDAAQKLEERIGQLSRLIERNFREAPQQPEYSSHLVDISRKIDGLAGPSDALMDRLDMLAQRLDEFERPSGIALAPAVDNAAMSRLETRLVDIAARLDESSAAPAADPHALANLEQQIASLSNLLSQPGNAAAPAGYAGQMTAIEDYMAASDEFIVEAARQAAEAVVEAYSRAGIANQAGNPADISALAGLAEDLRALESHTRSSEERTAETFSALHQTLVQIASRLDDLGERPIVDQPPRDERETYRQPEPARMPKATQPDFTDASAMMEPEPPRSAPKNSKVDVLQDVEMLVAAADADIAADAVQSVEATPAKQKQASKSLIAGLAAKIMPAKKEKSPARVNVDPAPALDAGEMLVGDESDSGLLMEPGTGVPDVKKIMERVRAGQKAGAPGGKPVAAGQADVIAAARRAAQAAAQEAGAQKFVQPAAKGKDKLAKPAKESKSIFGASGQTRRPILLAAAAVLLVVMSYPLVSNLISSRHQAEQPVKQPAVTDSAPADHDSAADPAKIGKAVDAGDQASLDTTPAMPKTVAKTRDTDTGAQTLMTPADSVDGATTLQKTETTTSADNLAAPAGSDTDALTKAAPADARAALPDTDADADVAQDKAETVTAPADTSIAPSAAVELPAGLQPASLAEAVKKGDPLAYFELGARYTDGRGGMKIDLASAAKWYQLAADKGFAPAEYRLASFYEKGTGVARDLDKAKAMYLSAAEKGNASAMHNLAVLYATSAAGNPDFGQAAHWFEAAANLNIRDSQFNLAILYARGSGVKQDLIESYKWFAIAARQGDQDAAQKRDEVANAMAAGQLKDAKARLDLWKPKAIDEGANTPVMPDAWVAKSNTTATVDMKRAIRNIQAILNNNGFDAGKPDGELGKKTVVAIKAFQKTVGQEPTGQIDDALVKELLKHNKKA